MKQSNKLKIGELLVHEGYITKDQLQEILSFQKKQKVYKPLGEICVELQFLSKNTLNKLLNTHKKRIQLGDLLINLGLITEGQLETALKHQKSRGGKLGETLLRLGFITENSLINTLTIQMGVPKIVPDFRLIERDLLEGISKEFLIKNEVLPAFKAEGVLTVIMSNPLDEEIIRDLKHIFRCSIEPAIAPAQDIVSTLEHYYQSLTQESRVTSKETSKDLVIGDTNLSQEDDDTIIGILNYIITNAFIEKASDIHIEPKEKSFCIRYRIDGMLQHKTDLPIHIAPSFISRLKVLCGLNIAEKRRHQDGRIHARIMDKEVDLRVSFYAFLYGENVVIRILQRQSDLIDIDSLGFSPTNKAKFQQILDQPSGIILATGPTGSGKTTTIYASLKYLNNTQKKIITVEDPIEYTIEGVIQGQINHKLGLSYSDFLKSMMRQDPDIIMVGEIRDTTAAEAVIQAALTGHKVLSTFHTDDTTGALLRLMHMEIDTFLISSTVVSIISQRLVRILCPYCRKPHIPDKHLLASFNMSSIDIHNVEFYEPAGCHYCGNRGFVGRTAIHELLVVNDSIRDAILSRKTSSQIRIIARDQANLISMREDGFYKATRGITSLEEILRVVFYNESDEFSPLSADKIITLCEKGTISLPVHPESPSTIQQTPSAQHIKGNGTVSTTTPHLSLLEGEQFRIRLDTTTIETDTDQIADFFKEYQKITEKMGNPLDHDLLETFVAFIFCTTKHLETSKQAEFFELSLHIKKETITILLETYIPHTLSSPSFRTTKETGLRLVNVLMPFSNLVFPPITEQNPIKKGEPYHKRISLLEFLKKNGTGLGKGNAKTHKKATALKTGLSKTQHTDADLQTKRSGVYKKYVEELEFHGYLAN